MPFKKDPSNNIFDLQPHYKTTVAFAVNKFIFYYKKFDLLKFFIRWDIGTTQFVCRHKHFSYHILFMETNEILRPVSTSNKQYPSKED